MATRNIVPRANGEGSIGTAAKHWGAGYFDTLPNWQEYLAESTGYGIVSGCEPSISGLTVTVAAGIVHLADGTRKELSATNITLDSADLSNPRIDLVYIDDTGTLAKVTGTAAATPSAPALPSGGISVATVSVAANATTGTVTDMRGMLARWYNAGVVNVKDFGAVGDGVTDDTAAIQAAVDNGSTIIISDGVYRVDVNKAIKIKDRNNISIYFGGNAKLYALPSDSQAYSIIKIVKSNNVKIFNGTLQGDRTEHIGTEGEWGHGINILSSNDVTVSNTTIKECWGDGIYIGSYNDTDDRTYFSQNVTLINCRISYCRRQGISIVGGDYTKVIACTISNISGTDPQSGIDVEPNGTLGCYETIIAECVIKDTEGYSIMTYNNHNENILISSCVIDNVMTSNNSPMQVFNTNFDNINKESLIRGDITFESSKIYGLKFIGGNINIENCEIGSKSNADATLFMGVFSGETKTSNINIKMKCSSIFNIKTTEYSEIDSLLLVGNVIQELKDNDDDQLQGIRFTVNGDAIIKDNIFKTNKKKVDGKAIRIKNSANTIIKNNYFGFETINDGSTNALMVIMNNNGYLEFADNTLNIDNFPNAILYNTGSYKYLIVKNNVVKYLSSNSAIGTNGITSQTGSILSEKSGLVKIPVN
jgi:hypothetical protein